MILKKRRKAIVTTKEAVTSEAKRKQNNRQFERVEEFDDEEIQNIVPTPEYISIGS